MSDDRIQAIWARAVAPSTQGGASLPQCRAVPRDAGKWRR